MKIEYDLAAEMDRILNPIEIKKQAHSNAITEALQYLDKAAEILDAMGSYAAAEVVTKMMEHIPSVIKTAQQLATYFNDPDSLRAVLRILLSIIMRTASHYMSSLDNKDEDTPQLIEKLNKIISNVGKLEAAIERKVITDDIILCVMRLFKPMWEVTTYSGYVPEEFVNIIRYIGKELGGVEHIDDESETVNESLLVSFSEIYENMLTKHPKLVDEQMQQLVHEPYDLDKEISGQDYYQAMNPEGDVITEDEDRDYEDRDEAPPSDY
jgi:hypothetical protein